MLAGIMVLACIALGSNLGDREANLRAAIAKINALPHTHVTAVSHLLETPAVDSPPCSPPFINATAVVETAISADDLMLALLSIERDLGRNRASSVRNAPRPIDLDLLLYGNSLIDAPNLKIPHPRMHERFFVLEPLAQIAANFEHPLLKQTIRQLLEALQQKHNREGRSP